MKKTFLVALILSPIFLGQVLACSYCSHSFGGLDAGSPILTMSAETLPRNKFALGYTMQFLDVDQFSAGKFADINRRGTHAHSYDSQLLNAVNVIYGASDNLNLIVSYPYNAKYNLKYTYDGKTYDQQDSIGLGDMTLLAKYRFLKLDKQKISVSALAGIRMPTGQTNERDAFGKLAPDEQPGSGSWDPIMGILINKRIKNISLDANAIYKLSTPGTSNVIVGDAVNYNFAVSGILGSRKIFDQKITMGWSMEANGLWRERVEYKGVKDNAHGGNTILLTPGIRLAINDTLITSFAVGLPVIENLNGDQPGTNVLLFASMNYVF